MVGERTQAQRSSLHRGHHEFVKWIRLWHEYLILSPSYDLARKSRQGLLTGDEALPSDFEAVLSVYDDLGPVEYDAFSEWWMERRIRLFGFGGFGRPSVVQLGVMDEGCDDAAVSQIGDELKAYHNQQWEEQGQPLALLAAIPVGLPKAQIIMQLTAMIEELPDSRFTKRSMNAKYTLTGTKLHRDAVVKYRDCLTMRARWQKAPLWLIGSLTKVSDIYSERLKPQVARLYSHEEQMADREAIKFPTSRAIKRAHMIAENAARGIFPSYKPCPHAMPMDLDRVRAMIEARIDAYYAERARQGRRLTRQTYMDKYR